ncbi:LuxR C-terminal-related transcriptional regulator [Nonomuraea monospora]|uniref:LuxR C-terminal-related transcriptional regulator n=1 Tax=Nonomuraea monospora TaxID=568818 RepID=UPI0031D1080E
MRALWPFAGRTSELASVAAALRSKGAVLAGPAGVGKSRLAAEAVREPGVAVVRATVAASGIPLGAVAHLLPPDAPGHNVLRWAADAIATRHRTLLADDAHLLDPVSAALVHHLAADGRIKVLVTLRSGERAPDAVTALWKDGLLPRLDLAPLTLGEAAEILAGALGGQVEPATAKRLWQVSGGNALFLRELVLAGESGGTLAEQHGVWRGQGEIPVTTRLRELIESRLGDVTTGERAALELIAYGEPLPLAALTRLVPEETLRGLEDRQLAAVTTPDLVVRLAHPLHGEVIRAGCGALRTREVLRGLAGALESAGPRTPEDLLRVAVWRLDSGTAADPAPLVRACHIARTVRDLELAARLGRAALAAGGGVAAGIPLANVLSYADRYGEAQEVLAGLAGAPMDDQTLAEYEVVRALNLFWGFGRAQEARAVLTDARELMSEVEPRQGVLTVRSSIEHATGLFGVARATLDEIRAIGPCGSRVTAGVVGVEAYLLLGRGLARQAMATADEALALIGRGPEQELPSITAAVAGAGAAASVLAGDLAAAERFAGIGYRIGEDYAGWDRALVAFAARRAQVLRLRGQVAEAVRLCRQALVRLRGRTMQAGMCLAELVHAYALAGDVAAMQGALRLADELVLPGPHETEFAFLLARPWTLAAEGDVKGAVEAALGAARAARGELHGAGAEGATVFPGYELLALHDVVRLGAGERVADRLGWLAQVVEGDLAPVLARHARARTPAELEQVSEALEGLGLTLHAAEAAAQAAAGHHRDGLRRAERAAETRAWTLARRCGTARTPALVGLAVPGLTARQRQIAQLAASGLSNPDIAERLVLSRRTVANTLVQVYERTGVSSRAGLARLMDLLE